MRGERELRVVHVDTERSWGGGQRQVAWLAGRSAVRGCRSWVAARPSSDLAREVARLRVPVVPLSPAFEFDPLAAARLRAALLSVDADVVHAHAAHAVGVAALAAAGTRARLVVSRRVALPLRRNPVSRWKYAQARRFIAVSERVASILEAGGIPGDRIAVVRSGVDTGDRSARASAATLRALGVAPDRRLVVMVSALVPPHKDPETFVEGVAAARAAGVDVQGLLVGAGPLRAAAERSRRRLGLEAGMVVAGFRRDALELLAAADVAVLASREEGLGTTLLDAMLAGVPVVATAAGGVREVVRDGIDGLLVPVGDGAALGAAIARVLRDARLRAALVSSGRQRVRRFSIERTVDDTVRECRAVVGQGTTGAPWA